MKIEEIANWKAMAMATKECKFCGKSLKNRKRKYCSKMCEKNYKWQIRLLVGDYDKARELKEKSKMMIFDEIEDDYSEESFP